MNKLQKSFISWAILWFGGWVFWSWLRVQYGFLLPWITNRTLTFGSEVAISIVLIVSVLVIMRIILGTFRFLEPKKSAIWLLLPYGLILTYLIFYRFRFSIEYFEHMLIFTFVSVFLQQIIMFGLFFSLIKQLRMPKKEHYYAAFLFALPHLAMIMYNPILTGLFWFFISLLVGYLFVRLRDAYGSFYPSFAVHWGFYLFFGLFFSLPVY